MGISRLAHPKIDYNMIQQWFFGDCKVAMDQDFFTQGLAKAGNKDYLGAIACFDQALASNPDFTQGYYHRGLAKFDSGDPQGAIADYTQALNLNSEYIEAYFARCLGHIALGDLPQALADIDRAIAINPNSAKAYKLRGTVYRKMGNNEAAIANFKQGAELYIQQKDAANARQCLDQIKNLQCPAPAPVFPQKKPVILPQMLSEKQLYAQLLEKAETGDIQGALAGLNWAVEVDPKDAAAYLCRGIVRCKVQNYREAIADFNQALKLAPEDITIYRNRGKARAAFGDAQGAIADYNKVLEKDPKDPLAYIARGNAYRETSKYAEAMQDYNQAIKINSQEGDAYYNRAIVHSRLEEISAAIQDYQTAAQIFCEKEDWDNYQKALDSQKKIQGATPPEKDPNLFKNQQKQRLLLLVGGYWEIAERLIQQAKDKYPGNSEQWYWEKVIADLERDRGL